MSSRKPRKRFESELDYTKDGEENSKILLREKYELLKWTDTIEIKSPNLFVPAQIANYIGALPFCKVAVSPRADRVAVMNHNRILNVYTIDGETTLQDCSVQVLEDDFAEYCLLHFSASGSLILSTRSSAQVDVFDHTGAYCYDIPLAEANHGVDLMDAVSAMSTVENSLASSDDKFMDILYVLQYNGTFSVFKIGRLSRYYKMWSVSLDIGLAGSFSILPEYNLLLVASHFRIGGEVKPPGGLCSFRLIASFPHVEPIRVASESESVSSRRQEAARSYLAHRNRYRPFDLMEKVVKEEKKEEKKEEEEKEAEEEQRVPAAGLMLSPPGMEDSVESTDRQPSTATTTRQPATSKIRTTTTTASTTTATTTSKPTTARQPPATSTARQPLLAGPRRVDEAKRQQYRDAVKTTSRLTVATVCLAITVALIY